MNGQMGMGMKTGSPVKEGSFLQRQTSVDDVEKEEEQLAEGAETK